MSPPPLRIQETAGRVGPTSVILTLSRNLSSTSAFCTHTFREKPLNVTGTLPHSVPSDCHAHLNRQRNRSPYST
eukprot:1308967-Rhodomonas_salina.1